MKLSIVIVNYNVRAYLEQCLRTVFKALGDMDGEVYVVDNQSTDGSVEMVREKFPQVKLIANQENVGFSRANNQAIRTALGEYVLLLNPDTVVGEDVFEKVIAFLEAHPKAGGLGVKMVDGTGRFLPESKRGLPTPQVAFFKIIGLTRIFPKSRLFGRYHLGHLPEDEPARIEILSGACMFLRKRTLDEVGLLDESFFMYGEDIDLSYRITLGGYENWYFPAARIIHYKGESTKKSSVNYVFVFYNAMAIFAQKHFTQRSAGIFPLLINGSIYLSAAGAIAVRFLNRAILPFLDLAAVMVILTLAHALPDRWPVVQEIGSSLGIASIAVGFMALFGAYDRPLRFLPSIAAPAVVILIGAIVRWAVGGPMDRWLDAALLCIWASLAFLSIRSALHFLGVRGYGLRRKEQERILAVGSKAEAEQALALLWQTHYGLGWSAVVDPNAQEAGADGLARSIRRNRVGEVVFCARDMPWKNIIHLIEKLRSGSTEFKIAQPEREFIIGPSSIESLQDLYVLHDHALNSPVARRNKRIVDVTLALLLLITLPIAAFFVRSPKVLFLNAISVLRGQRSWVGYHPSSAKGPKLPGLVPGVLDPISVLGLREDDLVISRANAMYAKDYSATFDIGIVLRGFRMLGGT
ncbi:MAG: glycosyltransferase [Flavobacteriales bacterium]